MLHLGVIRAYAEGVQDEIDDAKKQNYYEVIIAEMERMSGLITTLLDISKIWTKFYCDKNTKYSGSGLGLAIVEQILSMQHLVYGVSNQKDGVTFYFSIPVVK